MNASRKLAVVLVIALTALAVGSAPPARAGSAPPQVFPPQARPYGRTYGDWGVRFIQWMLAIPAAESPMLDTSGARCAKGQSGPVWYLFGSSTSPVIRTCTVPAGTALFIAPFTGECSTVQGNGHTFVALGSCATRMTDSLTRADVTVDGRVTHLLPHYRFKTSMFSVTYPVGNLLGVPGPGTSKMVADGFAVMVAPLATGRHTVGLRGGTASGAGEVTYHLTIGR